MRVGNIFFSLLLLLSNIICFVIMTISVYNAFCRIDLSIFNETNTQYCWQYFEEIIYKDSPCCNWMSQYSFSENTLAFLLKNVNQSFILFLLLETTFSFFEFYEFCNFAIETEDPIWNKSLLYNSVFEIKFFTKVNSFDYITFECLQDSIFIQSKETALVFFRIYSSSELDISCIIVFLVSPVEVLSNLVKLQCFCFDDMIITNFDSVDLPVIFSLNVVYTISVAKQLDILFFYLFLEK